MKVFEAIASISIYEQLGRKEIYLAQSNYNALEIAYFETNSVKDFTADNTIAVFRVRLKPTFADKVIHKALTAA